LNDVIAALRDSQEAFREAARKAETSDLRVMCMEFATQRAQFLGELQNEIERLGDPEPRDRGSVAGGLHRSWMKLRTALTSNPDQALIVEIERAENRLVKAYEEALQSKMPRYIRKILEDQLQAIGSVIAHLAGIKASFTGASARGS
jgi:uncharacterized protein (TIGR02284 family)